VSVYRDAEIQAMIDEFGVDVTIGAVTAKGIVDRTDEELALAGFSRGSGGAILVTVRTTTFPAIADGVAITVEGSPYKIGSHLKVGDGGITRILAVEN
jgi:hypothetical protein